MNYISVKDAAERWGITSRVVRTYCESNRIEGAFKTGNTWNIPENAAKPSRKQRTGKIPLDILTRIKYEKDSMMPGGIYHEIQIDFAYNSNHIEGSRLSHDQTRLIFETNTIHQEDMAVKADDVIEAANHFRALDYVIDNAKKKLSENMIKTIHSILKNGTSDSRRPWFAVGGYKRLENEVGGMTTADPEEVPEKMKLLLDQYNTLSCKTLDDILDFHYKFERIHPFQDGNGRVGRLIMFKECLKNDIIPFIIEDSIKLYYYRGLTEWPRQRGFLSGTCEAQQDKFKALMDKFGIRY